VVDYRTNVERQSREQKSVGNVLAIAVYALIGFFVVGAGLAGYGAHVIFVQLHQQSVTVSDLDNRFSEENKELNAKLATTLDTLTQAQAQIGREQELILKQQEAINQLMTVSAANTSALRQEKQARADETAQLRAQLKRLEYSGPTTQRY
jgi:septal ring factor EnvC (AmiA/AmiB activator)